MYTIPRKVTGYNSKRIGLKDFKALCYSLQGLDVLKVENIEGYEYPKNFYVADTSRKGDVLYIYMNCFVPLVAISKTRDDSPDFYDCPTINEAIEQIGGDYLVLSAEILESNIAEDMLQKLELSERKAVKYWLPSTVGEVIFSCFFD